MTAWKRFRMGAALILLVACGDDPTGPQAFAARMYIAEFEGRALFTYGSPYTPAAGPTDSLKRGTQRFVGMAVDANGNVAASIQGTPSRILFYDGPVRSGAVPRDSVSYLDYFWLPVFGPDGKLYVPTQSAQVLVYTPPFSAASAPDTVAIGQTNLFSVAFDATARMYVSDLLGGSVYVYDSPYTGAPAFTISGLATGTTTGIVVDKDGLLLVANEGTNEIVGFAPPLSGASTPAFVISVGVDGPLGLALGPDGRLYVANVGGGGSPSVTIYDPPFSDLSAPVITMSGGGRLIAPYGITVGAR